MYYVVPRYFVPEGREFNEFIRECVRHINAGENVEYNKDIVFRLTYHIALDHLKRYTNFDDVEELLPIMSIAFMKTLNGYDETKENASFLNYYKITIGREIIQVYNRHRNSPKEFQEYVQRCEKTMASLDEPLCIDDGENINLSHMLPDSSIDIENEIIYNDLKEEVFRLIPKLFPKPSQKKQEKIFEYCIGLSIEGIKVKLLDVADLFDTSNQYVSKILSKKKDELYDLMVEEGLI